MSAFNVLLFRDGAVAGMSYLEPWYGGCSIFTMFQVFHPPPQMRFRLRSRKCLNQLTEILLFRSPPPPNKSGLKCVQLSTLQIYKIDEDFMEDQSLKYFKKCLPTANKLLALESLNMYCTKSGGNIGYQIDSSKAVKL